MRVAYADPPYPGMAHLYKEHPDYAGEVDHAALIADLGSFDGWALSTNERSLQDLLALCPPGVRVLAWCKPNAPPFFKHPYPAWEPVICVPARQPDNDATLSFIVAGAPTGFLGKGLVGAKPRAFCDWLFRCLGALPGDDFRDLFPGTGGVLDAWKAWRAQPQIPRTAPRSPQDRATYGDAPSRPGRRMTPPQHPSPRGPSEELAWLRRCVDADSARLSLLRAEHSRLLRLTAAVVDSFDRKPTVGCVEDVRRLAEYLKGSGAA